MNFFKIFNNLIMYPRQSTAYLRAYFKNQQHIRGVEVGVYKGLNAQQLFKYFGERLRLGLVDPYDLSMLEDKSHFNDGTGKILQEAKRDALRRLSSWVESGHATPIYLKSETAHKEFLPELLDFVYIDANHSYEHTLQDLRLWWPKIRRGGVLVIDDWAQPPVALAIVDFCREERIEFETLRHPIGLPEVVIPKPGPQMEENSTRAWKYSRSFLRRFQKGA